jgi:hypothetical protein
MARIRSRPQDDQSRQPQPSATAITPRIGVAAGRNGRS